MEECDFGPNYSTWPSWCSLPTATNPCSIGDLTIPGGGTPEITIPSGGNISFYPGGSTIIGHLMNPLAGITPYIENTSSENFYFPYRLCVYK